MILPHDAKNQKSPDSKLFTAFIVVSVIGVVVFLVTR